MARTKLVSPGVMIIGDAGIVVDLHGAGIGAHRHERREHLADIESVMVRCQLASAEKRL